MKKLLSLLIVVPVMLAGCGKSNSYSLSLDTYKVELKPGDSKTINVTSGETNVVWQIQNPFVATVEKGKVTGCHIGQTIVFANNASALVTVSPRYNLYDEPVGDIRWGMTKNEVFKLMGERFPDTMEDNVFIYDLESAVNSFKSYQFDSDGKLIGVHITVGKEWAVQLDQFLTERYLELPGGSEQERHYLNGVTQASATMLISRTSYDDAYWLVSYSDAKYKR